RHRCRGDSTVPERHPSSLSSAKCTQTYKPQKHCAKCRHGGGKRGAAPCVVDDQTPKERESTFPRPPPLAESPGAKRVAPFNTCVLSARNFAPSQTSNQSWLNEHRRMRLDPHDLRPSP
ncbi:unnamed protein product, partial [Ectocarpus fasciculatus]